MSRSEHPSVGIRPVPDITNPEAVARLDSLRRVLDLIEMNGGADPLLNVSVRLDTVRTETGHRLTPGSAEFYMAADHVEVTDFGKQDPPVYVAMLLTFGDATVRATCFRPEALGTWTAPSSDGTYTLHPRHSTLPLWAE